MRRVGNVRWIGGTLRSISGSWSEETMTNRASPRRGFLRRSKLLLRANQSPIPGRFQGAVRAVRLKICSDDFPMK